MWPALLHSTPALQLLASSSSEEVTTEFAAGEVSGASNVHRLLGMTLKSQQGGDWG